MLCDPVAKLKDSLLMTGGAKIPALTRERQKILIMALRTSDPGKALRQVAAVQELLHDFADDGAIEPLPVLIGLFVDGFKFAKVPREALIEATRFGIARLIDPFEHATLLPGKAYSGDMPAIPT